MLRLGHPAWSPFYRLPFPFSTFYRIHRADIHARYGRSVIYALVCHLVPYTRTPGRPPLLPLTHLATLYTRYTHSRLLPRMHPLYIGVRAVSLLISICWHNGTSLIIVINVPNRLPHAHSMGMFYCIFAHT